MLKKIKIRTKIKTKIKIKIKDMKKIISVALALKREISKNNIFSYSVPDEIFFDENDIGRLVKVPFGGKKNFIDDVEVKNGGRKLIGVIIKVFDEEQYLQLLKNKNHNLVEIEKLRDILHIFHNLPKLDQHFFAADYYHQPFGDALEMSLPPIYRTANFDENKEIKLKIKIKNKYLTKNLAQNLQNQNKPKIILNDEQQIAVDKILASFDINEKAAKNFLLFGITGSGKTEIYLHLIDFVINKLQKQVLLLVPEINLTPQLENQIFQRFFDNENNANNANNKNANENFAVLHSDLTAKQRDFYWRLAASGKAKIILGTRLAIFTPLPNLGCIIVDEEHDLSFRQRDNFRYSARDLAVFRANNLQIPIVLGSASPSLESWYNATISKRYQLLTLSKRANVQAILPKIKIVDFKYQHQHQNQNENSAEIKNFISPQILEKIHQRLANKQQSLIFLNRRGYATSLFCANCGWHSTCNHCDSNTVVHLQQFQLRCHHCGFVQKLPTACPKCGEQNIFNAGLGTQKLEELIKIEFPTANIFRIDTDSVKNRQQWLEVLEKIHNSNADILIGTQMLAKGHDFPNLTLVAVLGADFGLFASDPRAEERIFAQLLQISGRAGRADKFGEVLIQTRFTNHHLFLQLLEHNYVKFADNQLRIRQKTNFPPYCYQALLRADAKNMAVATNFLADATQFLEIKQNAKIYENLLIYDPVPLNMAKLADVNRAQLLIETQNRQLLHKFINNLIPYLEYLASQYKASQKLSWFIEIDPPEL